MTHSKIKERRTNLVAALRSGKYVQTKGMLKRPTNISGVDNGAYFCCLGVACDLIDSDNWHYDDMDNECRYDDDSSTELTYDIKLKYGFKTPQGEFFRDDLPPELDHWLNQNGAYKNTFNRISLMTLNDAGIPFNRIADVIAAEPKGLFTE